MCVRGVWAGSSSEGTELMQLDGSGVALCPCASRTFNALEVANMARQTGQECRDIGYVGSVEAEVQRLRAINAELVETHNTHVGMVARAEDRARDLDAEAERLRGLIGNLYVKRGADVTRLRQSIREAFGASRS